MNDILAAVALWLVLSLVLSLALAVATHYRRPERPDDEVDPMPVDMPDRILERLDRMRPYE